LSDAVHRIKYLKRFCAQGVHHGNWNEDKKEEHEGEDENQSRDDEAEERRLGVY
jgi:hypothetical protein